MQNSSDAQTSDSLQDEFSDLSDEEPLPKYSPREVGLTSWGATPRTDAQFNTSSNKKTSSNAVSEHQDSRKSQSPSADKTNNNATATGNVQASYTTPVYAVRTVDEAPLMVDATGYAVGNPSYSQRPDGHLVHHRDRSSLYSADDFAMKCNILHRQIPVQLTLTTANPSLALPSYEDMIADLGPDNSNHNNSSIGMRDGLARVPSRERGGGSAGTRRVVDPRTGRVEVIKELQRPYTSPYKQRLLREREAAVAPRSAVPEILPAAQFEHEEHVRAVQDQQSGHSRKKPNFLVLNSKIVGTLQKELIAASPAGLQEAFRAPDDLTARKAWRHMNKRERMAKFDQDRLKNKGKRRKESKTKNKSKPRPFIANSPTREVPPWKQGSKIKPPKLASKGPVTHPRPWTSVGAVGDRPSTAAPVSSPSSYNVQRSRARAAKNMMRRKQSNSANVFRKRRPKKSKKKKNKKTVLSDDDLADGQENGNDNQKWNQKETKQQRRKSVSRRSSIAEGRVEHKQGWGTNTRSIKQTLVVGYPDENGSIVRQKVGHVQDASNNDNYNQKSSRRSSRSSRAGSRRGSVDSVSKEKKKKQWKSSKRSRRNSTGAIVPASQRTNPNRNHNNNSVVASAQPSYREEGDPNFTYTPVDEATAAFVEQHNAQRQQLQTRNQRKYELAQEKYQHYLQEQARKEKEYQEIQKQNLTKTRLRDRQLLAEAMAAQRKSVHNSENRPPMRFEGARLRPQSSQSDLHSRPFTAASTMSSSSTPANSRHVPSSSSSSSAMTLYRSESRENMFSHRDEQLQMEATYQASGGGKGLYTSKSKVSKPGIIQALVEGSVSHSAFRPQPVIKAPQNTQVLRHNPSVKLRLDPSEKPMEALPHSNVFYPKLPTRFSRPSPDVVAFVNRVANKVATDNDVYAPKGKPMLGLSALNDRRSYIIGRQFTRSF